MSGGIVLARHGATLMPCVICKRPTPPEMICPVNPKEGLCLECWSRAAGMRNWLNEVMMGGVAPVRVVLLMLMEPHFGARGQDGNGIRLLLRLLHEREEMRRVVADDGTHGQVVCCYCGADHDDHAETLVEVPAENGLPAIWYCADFLACDQRCGAQIAAMVGAAMREAADARREAAGVKLQ